MKYMIVVAMLLSASACSESPVDPNTDVQKSVGTNAISPDAPLEIAITQFPKAYMGRWGMTANDCISGASDAKGLISIQGSLVKFYESVGTMRNGKRLTLNSTSADFDMVGEGQEWRMHNSFQLTNDRSGLTRTDITTGERYVYIRCPA
jgi:hypothetical protein